MPVDLYVGGRRARGAAPPLRALLAQGAVRLWPGLDQGALPEAAQPGDDPRLQRTATTTTTSPTTRICQPRASTRPRAPCALEGETAIRRGERRGSEGALGATQRAGRAADEDGRPLHPTTRRRGPLEEVVGEDVQEPGKRALPRRGDRRSTGPTAMRLYELFMGPLEKGAPWSTEGHPRLLPLPAARATG